MHSSKEAIVAAYSDLVRVSGHAFPPVADVLRESGVARSTLYKHFDDRSALLVESMRGPFEILAVATLTGEVTSGVLALFEHFSDQRRGIAELLTMPHANRVALGLGATIQSRASGLCQSDAMRIAHSQLTLLRLWATGETPSPAEEMAAKFVAASTALLTALTTAGTAADGPDS